MSIDMYEHAVNVYISEDTVKGRGILEKTLTILKPVNKITAWVIISPVLPIILAFISIRLYSHNNYALFTVTALCSLVLLIGSITISFKKYSTIYTKSKSELPSFFVRKRDELILALISASLGAAFGAVLTYMLKK